MMPTQWKIRKKENIMKFNVGDNVKIVDKGEVYSTYNRWVGKHVPNKYKSFWAKGIEPNKADTYTIIACGNHKDYPSSMLYYIQNDNTKQCFIIGEEGIKMSRKNDITKYIKRIGQDLIDRADDITRDIKNVRSITIHSDITPDTILNYSIDKNYMVPIAISFDCHDNILDDKEKEYLKAVIKPFRNRIKYINLEKLCNKDDIVYIVFHLKSSDSMILPTFKKGTMYKNMKVNEKYTLKELGLDE